MIFWLDAQLPPALAHYLRLNFAVEAYPLRELGLRDATDDVIYAKARSAGAVLITKDQDFIVKSLRLGPPPQILWVTCGNCSNAHLREIFAKTFPSAMQLLATGEAIVEISAAV